MIVTTNLISGIDEVLHGENGAHGWGAVRLPDPTLLFVRGFDQSTNSYIYSVNERFGSTAASAAAFRVRSTSVPGHFASARIARATACVPPSAAAVATRRRPTDYRAGKRVGLRVALGPRIHQPRHRHHHAQGLAAPDARASRATAADRRAARCEERHIQAQIRKKIDDAGSNADPRALLLSIRPRLTDARQAREHALDAVKKILTQAQWNSLPDQLKSTGRGGPPRQQP